MGNIQDYVLQPTSSLPLGPLPNAPSTFHRVNPQEMNQFIYQTLLRPGRHPTQKLMFFGQGPEFAKKKNKRIITHVFLPRLLGISCWQRHYTHRHYPTEGPAAATCRSRQSVTTMNPSHLWRERPAASSSLLRTHCPLKHYNVLVKVIIQRKGSWLLIKH